MKTFLYLTRFDKSARPGVTDRKERRESVIELLGRWYRKSDKA